MNENNHYPNLKGKVALITGGGGILCSELARTLAGAGVMVAVLDLKLKSANLVATEINEQGGQAIAVQCDVLKKESIEIAVRQVISSFNRIDILINGAGGNRADATTNNEHTFFDIPLEAMEGVFSLNFISTILTCQIIGRIFSIQGDGVILNIASMNALRPLTRIPVYSAAKAAVVNFTQWLAVHMAQEFSPKIRVNAIAPGFFLTEQNRYLLMDTQTNGWTPRAEQILKHTPMSRFGKPEDLNGVVLWLVSSSSEFVTGIVIPVDGGFSAYSGV